jgi:5-methylcytosine-specific restriction endonuclease McrA
MILTPVLVLNASYELIAVCVARRALTMVCKGVARVEESHDHFIHREMRLSSVIRLGEYRRVPARRHAVSRKNIFLRDRHKCQYCSRPFPAPNLTLDHVTPSGIRYAACHYSTGDEFAYRA